MRLGERETTGSVCGLQSNVEVRMLTSKQASVELNVSRLERGLAIMRDVPWRKREATDADTVLFFFFFGGGGSF